MAIDFHCQHGIGRSALLALCVLVARGMALLAALELAKDRRAVISPSADQYQAWADWLRASAHAVPTSRRSRIAVREVRRTGGPRFSALVTARHDESSAHARAHQLA